MRLNCHDFKVKERLTIIPFGDMHYGSSDCDVDATKQMIEDIKNSSDTYVILMGDLINAGTKNSVGTGPFGDDFNPEKQYEEMLEMLKPIKHKVIGAHQGNHEERIKKECSFDITKMLARELGVPYLGYSALTKIKVNDQNYVIYSTHGSSNGLTNSTKVNACKRLRDVAEADIYIMGHTHGLNHEVTSVMEADLRSRTIKETAKHFILSGHYVNWDGSYGEMKNYPYLRKGSPRIRLLGTEWDVQVVM